MRCSASENVFCPHVLLIWEGGQGISLFAKFSSDFLAVGAMSVFVHAGVESLSYLTDTLFTLYFLFCFNFVDQWYGVDGIRLVRRW